MFLNIDGDLMFRNQSFLSRNKSSLFLLVLALIVGGVGAQATGLLNTESGGYLVCVNSKTKVITHPGTSSCPKGSKKLVLGAQGIAGADGKTLWNGVKDPESTLGAPGDMFINTTTKTLFGPKDLATSWPAGVSMVGPAGPQGPGGSGGAGATGATGPAGSNATLTCAQGGTCIVGNTGPGGGIVFYVQAATAMAPWRYLEAAPLGWSPDESAEVMWCNVSDAFLKGIYTGATPIGTYTGEPIGAGFYNSFAMLNTCSGGAAHVATSYNGGGKSDWFLPSKNELAQLYSQKTVVGGFVEVKSYWSSSENLASTASGQHFGTGTQSSALLKSTTHHVRPVRAF